MKRKFTAILLAMVLACSTGFTGCGKDKQVEDLPQEQQTQAQEENVLPSHRLEGNVLVWSMAQEPQNCDPAQYTTATEASVLNNVMEGLYRMEDGEAVPALAKGEAEHTENEDGTVTYTYQLRAATWSDGKAVKAQDFVYAWKRAAQQTEQNSHAYLFGYFAANAEDGEENEKQDIIVEAQGDDTLSITLRCDVPYFDQLLSLPVFFPLREDIQPDALKEGAVFNGPFTIGEITPGKEIILEKNSHYHHADYVALDYIAGKLVQNGDWEKEKADLGTPTAEIVEKTEAVEFASTQYLLINAASKNEALKDKKVREALSMMLDRSELAEQMGVLGEPAEGLVPSAAGGKGGLIGTAADIQAAKALLQEAKVEPADIQLELLTVKNQTNQKLADAIAAMWEQIGIQVTVTAKEAEEYYNDLESAVYPDVALSGWYADANDPSEFLNIFLPLSQSTMNGYSSLAYDKAMLTAMEKTGEERQEAMAEAEKILLEDGYVLPLYHGATAVADSKTADGWEVDSRGIYWFGDAEKMEEAE